MIGASKLTSIAHSVHPIAQKMSVHHKRTRAKTSICFEVQWVIKSDVCLVINLRL